MERYESLGLVGEGSYGTVLKCRHRDSGLLVAIKKFLDSDDDKTVKKIALREIKLLRQLRHDNLVNLLEVWKRRRRWYLVFEFVDRTLLDDLEQNPGGLERDTSRRYLYQILRAAAFCHQQNVIHRDIKPENILISQEGVVKLCDFGFARAVASPNEGTVHTDYVATRWYRAPELLVGDTQYGKPVDVWAIGCLLLEMLTGQPLFPGDSDLDQIHHIVRCFGNLVAHHQQLFCRNPVFSGVRLPECSTRVSLKQRFPGVTPAAIDLAQSCLEMDPGRRAQCSELLEHQLFTQDSFPIRFLDELNAKIQRSHRENSTLPKINQTPRLETEGGSERNHRGKDRKGPEDMGDSKDKLDKTKGKPPVKTPKCNRNTSEPLVSSKGSLGNKIQGQSFMSLKKSKEKPSIGESRKTTTTIYNSPKLAKTIKNNTTEATHKYSQRATPDSSKDKEDARTDNSVLDRKEKKLAESLRSSISEHEFEKSLSNQKTFQNSQSLASKQLNVEKGSCPTNRYSQVFNQTEAGCQTLHFVTKASKTSNTSKHQADQTKTSTLETRPESPKVLPSSPRSSKPEFNFNLTPNKNSPCLPKAPSQTPDLHSQCPTVFPEHTVLEKGFSYPTMSKASRVATLAPQDRLGIKMKHKAAKSNLLTEEAMNSLQITKMSNSNHKGNPVVTEQCLSSWKTLSESQRTLSTVMRESSLDQTSPMKTVTPLVKENRTDISVSGPTAPDDRSHREKPANRSHLEFSVKTLKSLQPKPLVGDTKAKPGSFGDHIRTTVTPNPHKAVNAPQRDAVSDIVDSKLCPPELKISTRPIVCPPVDAANPKEFELKALPSSPPPPPPPPTSTPLLAPPFPCCPAPSSSVVSFSGSVAGDPCSSHPGTSGLRGLEMQHGGVYSLQAPKCVSCHPGGSLPVQANMTQAPLRTRERTNIRFPPVHQQNQSNPPVPMDKTSKSLSTTGFIK